MAKRKIEIGYRCRSRTRIGSTWNSPKVPLKDPSGWFVPPPDCGPLAVFETLEHARRFVDKVAPRSPFYIDKVAFVRSKQTLQWRPRCLAKWQLCYDQWHIPGGSPCYVLEPQYMPKGKVLVDAFYVLEEDVCSSQGNGK